MTVADLQSAGVAVDVDEEHHRWRVHPGSVQLPDRVMVEPDLSNAAPFLGAALIAGERCRCRTGRVRRRSREGLLPGILQAMGAEITWDGRPWSEATTGEDAPAAADVDGAGRWHDPRFGTFRHVGGGGDRPSIAALAALADAPTQLVASPICVGMKRIVWPRW